MREAGRERGREGERERERERERGREREGGRLRNSDFWTRKLAFSKNCYYKCDLMLDMFFQE